MGDIVSGKVMPLTLTQRVQQFYDQSSGLWEQVWGEHMHHGYYGWDGRSNSDRRQAQIDLIEELLLWGQPPSVTSILDVGCGIGGSSLYLAQKFQARVAGITLSPVQAARATQRAQQANLASHAQFSVADALHMPFDNDSFDLVWSLESAEHMPDKTQFLQECYRVLKPGGRLIVATWCHRSCEPPKPALVLQEQQLLKQLYEAYHLPYIISLPDYETMAQDLGFQQLHTADWSRAVAPFWDEVILSALNPSVAWNILTAGWQTVQGAFALSLMSAGYRQGLIRYGLLRATK
jgi:tocopherol O-methyltransferase